MEEIIREFLTMKTVALVGASENPKKWGNSLFKELIKKGYRVYPVNPKTKEISGEKCYPSVKELPQEVENLILAVPKNITEQVVKDCPGTGIKRVWMQKGFGGEGSTSEEALKFCKENGIDVVYDLCPMMFIPPAGFHKVHFFFKKLLRTFPKGISRNF
ncbi:CoA-binding protein [Bacteroidota bacterium]